MAIEVTNEEILAELEAMKKTGKHHTPKSVRKNKDTNRRLRIILIIVLIISILICSFVWISSIDGDIKKDGYIINVDDYKDYYGTEYALELAYDPTFSDHYKQLVGLGYGQVDQLQGGSMFESLGTNTTMFDKFKQFAEDEKVASQYEGNEGSANFDQYYCNKYYIRNTSNQYVKYRLNLKITQNVNDTLHAARFMFVSGDDNNFNYQILATANKETGKKEIAAVREVKTADYLGPGYFTNPNLVNVNYHTTLNKEEAWLCDKLEMNTETGFYQYQSVVVAPDGKVISGDWFELAPGASTCYTVCIWFEGSDPDHNDSIKGGTLSFSISYETEAYVIKSYEIN